MERLAGMIRQHEALPGPISPWMFMQSCAVLDISVSHLFDKNSSVEDQQSVARFFKATAQSLKCLILRGHRPNWTRHDTSYRRGRFGTRRPFPKAGTSSFRQRQHTRPKPRSFLPEALVHLKNLYIDGHLHKLRKVAITPHPPIQYPGTQARETDHHLHRREAHHTDGRRFLRAGRLSFNAMFNMAGPRRRQRQIDIL